METKTLRPLDVVLKDLNDIAIDIEGKKKKLAELSNAQSDAFNSLETSYKKAAELRAEMEEFLNLLVPSSQHNRVRLSS